LSLAEIIHQIKNFKSVFLPLLNLVKLDLQVKKLMSLNYCAFLVKKTANKGNQFQLLELAAGVISLELGK